MIVNHNTRPHLEGLLHELNEDRQDDVKIHVLDGGSSDDSKVFLANNPDLYDSYYDQENLGYARSINYIAERTEQPYLAALNADLLISSTQALSSLRLMSEQEKVAVVGPKQRNQEGRIVHAGIVGNNIKPTHRGWMARDSRDQLFADVRECVTVSGSAYFMNRAIWQELASCELYRKGLEDIGEPETTGAFLPTPHYYEETFYSYHARAHGYKVMYDGTVSIMHAWRASTAGDNPILRDYFNESRKLFRTACDAHSIERD